MIIKPYAGVERRDPRLAAGMRAERQLAHYLDRYFRDSDAFLLLHGLRLEHQDDVAQIDHLVLHKYGAVIVESKSVSTAVRINSAGEWERRSPTGWSGMPDPVLQAERQGLLLKRLLVSYTNSLLDKAAFGLLQGTFTHMSLDHLVAISDQGRITRAHSKQAPQAMKADTVPGAIQELVSRYEKASNPLTSSLKAFAAAPRTFNSKELLRIGHFLRTRHKPLAAKSRVYAPAVDDWPGGVITAPAIEVGPTTTVDLRCSHCGSSSLRARSGRYGPYGSCGDCTKNTAVRINCRECGERVPLEVSPPGFRGTCRNCGAGVEVRLDG